MHSHVDDNTINYHCNFLSDFLMFLQGDLFCYFYPKMEERSSESSSRGCFPSSFKVSLENGDSVTMSELQIGDRVQTGT